MHIYLGVEPNSPLWQGTNNLRNPCASGEATLCHDNLRQLFLSCNPIDSFEAVARNLRLPRLELLSLAECPVWSVPDLAADSEGEEDSTPLGLVHHLNLSTTKISSWEEVRTALSCSPFESFEDNAA